MFFRVCPACLFYYTFIYFWVIGCVLCDLYEKFLVVLNMVVYICKENSFENWFIIFGLFITGYMVSVCGCGLR